MARITRAEIETRVAWFNSHNGSYTIQFSRRYEYYALDLYADDGGMIKTLKTGTMRECYTYMTGIMAAMDLFELE